MLEIFGFRVTDKIRYAHSGKEVGPLQNFILSCFIGTLCGGIWLVMWVEIIVFATIPIWVPALFLLKYLGYLDGPLAEKP